MQARNKKLDPLKSFCINSNDIPVCLPEVDIIDAQSEGLSKVAIDLDLVFNVDRLYDSDDERFHFVIKYVFQIAPCHYVLRDYIMRDDAPRWEQPVKGLWKVSQKYTDTPLTMVELESTDINEDHAELVYSLHTI